MPTRRAEPSGAKVTALLPKSSIHVVAMKPFEGRAGSERIGATGAYRMMEPANWQNVFYYISARKLLR